MTRVTVLIVGYKSERWLAKCIETLRDASDHRLQLCFVDNLENPTWESLDVSAFDVEVLKTPHPMGFADANNFGIRHSQFESDYVVFLNQDTFSGPGWIDECVRWCEEHPDVGIVSPGLRTYDLGDWEQNLVACIEQSGMSPDLLKDQSFFTLENVTAAAMMIRTQILREVGPFDPIFGSYYEDYDLCRRVRMAGSTVAVASRAVVGHFSGSAASNPEAVKRRARVISRNRVIHAVRESRGNRLWTLIRQYCFVLPRTIARGLLRTKSAPPLLATIGAHWDLLKISRRLASENYDRTCWMDFLNAFHSEAQA